MSEIRTMNTALAFIYDPDVVNAAFRGTSREIQNALAWLLFDTANAGSAVLGGFSASEGAALRSDVVRGAALRYDSGAAAPLSKWAFIYSEATLQATHDAHEGNPRYDLLSLSFTTATDTTETQGQVGDVPASVNTQRGCAVTLVLTKGTAAGSPSIPSTPAGNLALYAVYVPATSGSLEYIEVKTHGAGPARRTYLSPLQFDGPFNASAFQLALINARKIAAAGDSFQSSLQWDIAKDWPIAVRGRGDAGEFAGSMFPMMVPTDRKWRRNVPIGVSIGPVIAGGSDAGGLATAWTGTQFTLSRSSSSRGQISAWVAPIPVDGRGLKALSATATIRRVIAFDGTVTYLSAVLCVQHVDGTVDAIGVADLDGTAGAIIDVDFVGAFVPTLIAAGDVMYVKVVADTTGNTVGTIYVYAVSVEFEEGHE